MRRYVRRKGSFNVGGLLMRAIFVQSITRNLPIGHLGRTGSRAVLRGMR